MTLNQVFQHIYQNKPFEITSDQFNQIERSHQFLIKFAEDKVIYGINTGFGPMSTIQIDESRLNPLQYNLIRSHANGTGMPLNEPDVLAILIARLQTLLLGRSGVHIDVVKKIQSFINQRITPYIPQHGSVGASGDLVQLAHVALALIGEGHVIQNNALIPTKKILDEHSIMPLKLHLRDGLALINGTSCMCGIAINNLFHAKNLISWSIIASSMLLEIAYSYDDSISKELNASKHHTGQQKIAQLMRHFLKDSQRILNRKQILFDKTQEKEQLPKLQEYYSLRCTPQILGPIWDCLSFAEQIIEGELNSTNDNPVVDFDTENIYHGGNFHGDYVSFEMDKVKLGIVKLSMLFERQLNYLLNPALNQTFPAFLNSKVLGFNFGFQGIQYTATSTTAENQTLSNSMYVHSIPSNNDNQDIVSMGSNSALLTRRVIENTYEVLAIHLMAIMQAVDLSNEKEKFSSKSKFYYEKIRNMTSFLTEDLPQYEKIKDICSHLKSNFVFDEVCINNR